MKLKDLANCKFIGYGDDYRPSDSSVNLEEWFLQVIICKIVEDNLVKNFDAFRCRQSLIALRMIRLNLKDGTSRYFEADEFFYPKEKLKNMSIIQILNCHMMKLHHKHWKKKRHFIIICEPEEKYKDIIPVPGVDRLTLKEFELKFGSNERILLQ